MTLLLTAGTLVRGPADDRVADGAVLVDGDRIVAAGPRGDVERAPGAADARRRHVHGTLLPGLIDAHVHLAFDGGDDPAGMLAGIGRTELEERMAARAATLVRAGVTTARDLGDLGRATVGLRAAIRRGERTGPRLVLATTPLTSPGGHCWFLGGEVGTPEQVAALVADNARAGADLIKVMASGGAMTPGGPPMWQGQFTRDELAAVVRAAHAHGLPVAAHAHGTATIDDCVAAGVATIEHCSWRTPDRMAYDPEIARRIAESGVAVCRCVSGDWRDFLRRLGANAEPLTAAIRAMRAAGVRFVAGTDAGVPGAAFDDYAGMLEFFAEIGFTPGEILDMATVHAADALGLGAVTGRLRPGMSADVLAVDGDPADGPSVLRRPRLVLAGGRDVRRGA
ncbi:MAG: amidohydrolase family protein [Actinomycetota bacterium]|nr:amidohydrolase family protein [Actinomycetota bacterium]